MARFTRLRTLLRLKTSIWVAAYIRRCAVEHVPAVVARHGDDDAGAIFIRISRLDGTGLLLSPAPAGLDGAETERRWVGGGAAGLGEADIDVRLATETRFDPDLWIIEVEDRRGRHFLDDCLTQGLA